MIDGSITAFNISDLSTVSGFDISNLSSIAVEPCVILVNALLNDDGSPILNDDGSFILTD